MNLTEKDESRLPRVAAVVPRYGENLGGGAETLVRTLVEDLANAGNGDSCCEIWTTCAKDHRTWENYYPEGQDQLNGVTIRRFPVDARNLDLFVKHEIAIAEGRPLLADEQLEWLEQSVNSRGLYRHIIEHGEEFDAILFAPYLFATTFWGSLVYPERSILIPCLHDENYAYLGAFQHMFSSAKGLIFNAEPEGDLAQRLYSLDDFEAKSCVVGMGFDEEEYSGVDVGVLTGLKQKFPQLDQQYLLYAGRKEQGKNLDLLINWYSSFRLTGSNSAPSLVVMGSGDMEFLTEVPEGLCDVGFVSEEEKIALMENALALCQPSTNESFSIVLMEAWLRKVPVLVHSDCDVTKHHVVESGGGLHFGSAEQFRSMVQLLLDDSTLRERFGSAGQEYVRKVYSKAAVRKRFLEALAKFDMNSATAR
jgi:glycosyltransferase involved in cell wall biosynthesis